MLFMQFIYLCLKASGSVTAEFHAVFLINLFLVQLSFEVAYLSPVVSTDFGTIHTQTFQMIPNMYNNTLFTLNAYILREKTSWHQLIHNSHVLVVKGELSKAFTMRNQTFFAKI